MTSAEELDEMVQLLRSGRSPAEIQRQLVPAPWRAALRACAAAGVVTAELFDSVLRGYAGPTPPRLTELAERGLIEPVTHEQAAWRVPPTQAADWMREWHTGEASTEAAPELNKLEAELARWHEGRGNRSEQLRHLLVADPTRALDLFNAMFENADRNRDFADCQDLLDVLADPNRITLAGRDVSEARLDRAGFLRARLLRADDYARSAQFLPPPGLVERTKRLIAGNGPHVWQLFAPSGTGKTIQLQWLAGRYCVTSEHDIPCARIDFDVIDPVSVARHPWLLLLEVADQLDRRWPRRIFERLDRFSSYRSLARRQTSELSREAAQGLADLPSDEIAELVKEIFVRRVNAYADQQRPMVVIVDTMEEVLLGGGSGVDRLMSLLGEIVRECPGLRLVLAGRYDLREKAPEAMAELRSAKTFQVRDFSPPQANRYLSKIRGIDDAGLRAAVVARASGQPFLVALFADVIESDPGISADELRAYRDPSIRLLIDRIIQRIPDPDVRWLVRYGVVPRRLRLDDVVEVMGPFMTLGRSGPSDSDDPRLDQHHLSGREDIFPFGPSPQGEVALTATWQRLLTYAAHPSWVSPADGGRSVVFHPNVRGPMQDLIRERPVYRQLHQAFRDRFERLAAQDPARAAAYLREAVYHRVQLADPGAADFWREQVSRYRDRGDLDAAEELAGELLREDYLEDALPRRRGDGTPLLAHAVVVEAHVLNAYVAAERARAVQADADDPLWSTVKRSLASADFVREHAPEPAPPSALEVGLRGAVLVSDDKPEDAVALTEPALRDTTGASLVDLLRVAGDAHAALGQPGTAESKYVDGLELATELGRADQQYAITRSLAAHSESQGRLDRAMNWIRHPAQSVWSATADVLRPLLRTMGRLLIDCYQPGRALRLLADASRPNTPDAVENALLRAEAHRVLGRSEDALSELLAAADVAEQLAASAGPAYLARIHQLRAVLLGELLAVDEAEDSFERATSLWGELGFAEGHPDCTYQYRRFLIRSVGDLAAAARVPAPPMRPGSEQLLLWDEQTAELRIRQHLDCDRLTEAELSGLAPPQAARVIAVRLACSWSQHRYLMPALENALQRISPPSARLVVLEELRRCDRANRDDVHSLSELFERAVPDLAEDAALQRGLLAELDRLGGNAADAARALDEVAAAFPPPPSAQLARWRWLQARSRLRKPALPRAQATPLIAPTDEYPLLRAASLLTMASATRPTGRTLGQLQDAMRCCEQVGRPTCWTADVFAELGRRAPDSSLLASSDGMNQRLGRPHRAVRGGWAGPVLSDRPGERVARLFSPDRLPDLIPLQRRLVGDWPALAREMANALFDPPNMSRVATAGLAALRLQSADAMVQALPWELTVPPRDLPALRNRWPDIAYRSMPEAADQIDTRWLQRGLCDGGDELVIDGVPGPNTLAALRRVAPDAPPVGPGLRAELARRLSRAPGGRPAAILLRPESLAGRDAPSHEDWGFDAADLYVRVGFKVWTVSSLSQLPAFQAQNQVTVLHITARMDNRGSGAYFDFSPTETQERLGWKARGTDVHPKDIARWLRVCGPGREPLVVLDPPYPGSRFDVPWQLLLRNLFAATLFAEAVAPAIIGTGARDTGPAYITGLAQGIAAGLPLAQIAATLRGDRSDPWRHEDYEDLIEAGWQTAASDLAALATTVFAAPSAYPLPPGL